MTRDNASDLRAAGRLVVEATQGVTGLVEAMHRTIAGGPALLGAPLEMPARVLTGLVYGSIRGVTGLVGASLDRAFAQLAPLLGESAPGVEREAVLAVLNGVLGDHLFEAGSPLAIEMRFRQGGRPLTLEKDALLTALPDVGSRLLVLVHGSCRNDLQWNRLGHDHGTSLATDLGYTPVYLHYNSGMHISTNGRAFAGLLERLVSAWPTPVEDLVVVAHSMGGLVSRSACHAGEEAGQTWRRAMRKLVCLGSPHHGAPLERGGNALESLLRMSRYGAPLARLGRIRSAGVTDMRFGSVLDGHWQGRDRFAQAPDPRSRLTLPEGVECYAIAATTAAEAAASLPGDGLVPVSSALGMHEKPELTLAFPESNRWIAYSTNHFDLLSRADVYRTIRAWLSA